MKQEKQAKQQVKPNHFLRVEKLVEEMMYPYGKDAYLKELRELSEISQEIKEIIDPRSTKKKKGEPSKHYGPYGRVRKSDFFGLCTTQEELNSLYNDLIDNAYLDVFGNITKRFKSLKTYQALEISSEFEVIKEKVFVTFETRYANRPYFSVPMHNTGGTEKLKIVNRDIDKTLHERLDFDLENAYLGVMTLRKFWISHRHPSTLEKWEREIIDNETPEVPIKSFVIWRHKRKLPHVELQESPPTDMLGVMHMRSRKIDSAYLRWRHSDIASFIDGNTSVDPLRLFNDIISVYKRYCHLQDENAYSLLALWIIGTYMFPLFPAYPIILLNGPKGSGKSRTTTVSACLAFNAYPVTDPNQATIFRLAEGQRASVLLEDAEWLAGKNPTRLLSALKSSYKATAKVPRVGKNVDCSIDEYEIYSPKMFNNINGVDHVMASRSITIPFRCAPKSVKIDKHDPDENDPLWAELRNRLYLFMFNYWKDIRDLVPKQAKLPLYGRQYELYVALLSIAQFLDKHSRKTNLHGRTLKFALDEVDQRKSEYIKLNPEALTIQALQSIVLEDDWYAIPLITHEVKKLSDSPKDITDARVGRLLKSLGLGIHKRDWRRPRVIHDGKELRPTEYFIRRSVVESLAEEHGLLD